MDRLGLPGPKFQFCLEESGDLSQGYLNSLLQFHHLKNNGNDKHMIIPWYAQRFVLGPPRAPQSMCTQVS